MKRNWKDYIPLVISIIAIIISIITPFIQLIWWEVIRKKDMKRIDNFTVEFITSKLNKSINSISKKENLSKIDIEVLGYILESIKVLHGVKNNEVDKEPVFNEFNDSFKPLDGVKLFNTKS